MDNKEVAKAIAYLRKAKKYTQRDLADKLGISDKAVSKWERGLGIPDVSLLARLSILLDTDIESLLEGNVSHHKQNWAGLLWLDDPDETNPNRLEVYAGTMIYDKPIVYYMLSYFMLVGIKKILIVCSARSRKYIEDTIDKGDSWGIDIACADRTVLSMKQINDIIIDFAQDKKMAIVYGYHLLYGIDLTKFMQRAMSNDSGASILALPYKTNHLSHRLFYDTSRQVLDGNIRNEEAYERYYSIPFVFCSSGILKCNIMDEKMSFEGVCNYFMQQSALFIELIGRGMFSMEIDDSESLLMASEFVNIIQRTQGISIADLKEIAARRGLIDINNINGG